MKLKIIYGVMILMLAGLMVSCDDEEVDLSTRTNVAPFLAAGPTMVMVDEEAGEITINFTLSEEQIVPTRVVVEFDEENSTATLGQDFTFTSTVVAIDAHEKRGSFTVMIERDLEDFEEDAVENARFVIKPSINPPTILWSISNEWPIDVLITNLEGEDLAVEVDWGFDYMVDVTVTGTAPFGGPFDLITGAPIVDGSQTLNGCAFADIDVLVVNDEFTTVYGASAQTGACPEMLNLPATGDITNGATARTDSFFILPEMWLNWGSSEFTSPAEPMQIVSTVYKAFNNTPTEVYSHPTAPGAAFPTNQPGDLGSFASLLVPFMYVIRDDGVWTVYDDFSAEIIFEGRIQGWIQDMLNGSRTLQYEDGSTYVPYKDYTEGR